MRGLIVQPTLKKTGFRFGLSLVTGNSSLPHGVSLRPVRYGADQRLLFRGPDRVPLVPKVAETLHVLIERHGQVVDKADLMKLVWPDAVVEEIGLVRNISLLRKALEVECAENPIIETVPRRGYRFAAPVTPGTPAPSKLNPRRWPIALAARVRRAAGLEATIISTTRRRPRSFHPMDDYWGSIGTAAT